MTHPFDIFTKFSQFYKTARKAHPLQRWDGSALLTTSMRASRSPDRAAALAGFYGMHSSNMV
jgi:hypothetical protein